MSPFCRRARSRSASWVLLGVVGFAPMAEAASVTVSIPAQSLVGALRAFAEQSGVQVLYEPSLVEGKRAAAVNGAMESNDALSRLLRGSGLLYQVDNGTVLLLAPPPTTQRWSSALPASPAPGWGDHARHWCLHRRVSIGKMPQSIKDTPQSIRVITRQRMEDLHLTSMNDVLTQTSLPTRAA